METLEERINKFLHIETGSGYGYGYGDGDGDGSGSGYGYGSGYGDGYGDGNGYGYGSGDGIKSIDGQEVYLIDNTETVITSVKGDIAQGFILNKDLTLTSCFICKGENKFAHGENLHEANQALQAKLLEHKPISERINMFKEQFPDFNKSYKNIELYNWHHILTGSCKMGRDSFAADRGIDIKNGSMTINKFIELTKNSFGGEIINQLKQ